MSALEHRPFLRAIRENPGPNSLLVYADWLLETGQTALSDHYRAHAEREALPPEHPERFALEARRQRLQRAAVPAVRALAPDVPGLWITRDDGFESGYGLRALAKANVTADQWHRLANTLPIVALTLDYPFLPRKNQLDAVAQLLDSDIPLGVQHLDVRSLDIEAIEALQTGVQPRPPAKPLRSSPSNARRWPNLRSLRIATPHGLAGASLPVRWDHLAGWPAIQNLRIVVHNPEIVNLQRLLDPESPAADLRSLAIDYGAFPARHPDVSSFPNLQTFRIHLQHPRRIDPRRENELLDVWNRPALVPPNVVEWTAAGLPVHEFPAFESRLAQRRDTLRAWAWRRPPHSETADPHLVRWPGLPEVQAVNLQGLALTQTTLQPFRGEQLPHSRLRELDLAENQIQPQSLANLLRDQRLQNLQHLRLAATPLQPPALQPFRENNAPPDLRNLDLGWCRLDDQAAAHLLAAPALDRLETLDLRGNPLTKKIRAALQERFPPDVLLLD